MYNRFFLYILRGHFGFRFIRMATGFSFIRSQRSWRSGAQFHLSSVHIKTLNIRIRIKTIDFISVTIESKRRHDTCTCICVYWNQSGDVLVPKLKQYWHWKNISFRPFSSKVSVGECRWVFKNKCLWLVVSASWLSVKKCCRWVVVSASCLSVSCHRFILRPKATKKQY